MCVWERLYVIGTVSQSALWLTDEDMGMWVFGLMGLWLCGFDSLFISALGEGFMYQMSIIYSVRTVGVSV